MPAKEEASQGEKRKGAEEEERTVKKVKFNLPNDIESKAGREFRRLCYPLQFSEKEWDREEEELRLEIENHEKAIIAASGGAPLVGCERPKRGDWCFNIPQQKYGCEMCRPSNSPSRWNC